jgi:hypothetical protein
LITGVNAPRNTNASLFTTVLCACLGLLVAGTPLQAQARRAVAEVCQSENSSAIRSGFEASVVVSLRKLKQDDRWLPSAAARAARLPAEISYRNTRPLTDHQQVLLVTRLPRAGLSISPAQLPQAF